VQLQRAMAAEAEATREARAKVGGTFILTVATLSHLIASARILDTWNSLPDSVVNAYKAR